MRTIEISTDLFAKIWSHRRDGEDDENSILKRLLGVSVSEEREPVGTTPVPNTVSHAGKILWRDDVRAGLTSLGGQGHLLGIYDAVRDIRRKAGRSLPRNTDAIIRRELENNSSDSDVYLGRFDWFRSVDGIGNGVWALRAN